MVQTCCCWAGVADTPTHPSLSYASLYWVSIQEGPNIEKKGKGRREVGEGGEGWGRTQTKRVPRYGGMQRVWVRVLGGEGELLYLQRPGPVRLSKQGQHIMRVPEQAKHSKI